MILSRLRPVVVSEFKTGEEAESRARDRDRNRKRDKIVDFHGFPRIGSGASHEQTQNELASIPLNGAPYSGGATKRLRRPVKRERITVLRC
ncbi:hypothetical protein EVAR_47045_1 [Eumeta japonica]|uniref:Uncharacterized protein n=1 Tax=Eumeta variegata TaxID=151549 RepID=A0A4C1XGR4_EUMVA|nr:hypothetical protein EVAR_47045_1 [Eumeta japonica]